MSIKHKIRNRVSPLYHKVWHGPKGRLTDRISDACEALPRRQRLTVVTILLSAFVLMAFFVFGHACYEMGARHAYQQDSKFIRLLTEHDSAAFIQGKKPSYEEMKKSLDNQLDTIAYEGYQ